MAFNFTFPLRITQAVLAIIVMGLIGYVIHWWSHFYHQISPSQFNFLLFSAIWTFLALAYLLLAPGRFPSLAHKFAVLAVEALTMLFWFAGFIAQAVFLSERVCFGHVCDSAKAAAAFAAFEWVAFAATTALAALHVFRSRGSRDPAPAPNMAFNHGV